ncbi:hypothetical protein O3P69_017537 [Scylla paramamosain]|uniref:Uncharacterized protein n=1 Tax=Scylla paramamosain TaxID=85552 RepID=A0AAW0TY16_SCYPA
MLSPNVPLTPARLTHHVKRPSTANAPSTARAPQWKEDKASTLPLHPHFPVPLPCTLTPQYFFPAPSLSSTSFLYPLTCRLLFMPSRPNNA